MYVANASRRMHVNWLQRKYICLKLQIIWRQIFLLNLCSLSHNLYAKLSTTSRNKYHKLRVTSPAECRLTYLQFAGEFTRAVIAVTFAYSVFFQQPLAFCLISEAKSTEICIFSCLRCFPRRLSWIYLFFASKRNLRALLGFVPPNNFSLINLALSTLAKTKWKQHNAFWSRNLEKKLNSAF